MLVLILLSATAQAAPWAVIAASGPEVEIEVGDRLSGGTTLTLGAGQVITLLAPDGRVIRAVGPVTASLPGDAEAPQALPQAPEKATGGAPTDAPERPAPVQGQIIKPKPLSRAVTAPDPFAGALEVLSSLSRAPDGTTREPGASAVSQPELWLVAVDSSGNRCVRGDDIAFWRAKADTEERLDLRSETLRKTGMVWPAGKHRLPLPKIAVPEDGLMVVKIGTLSRSLNLHVLPDNIPGDDWGEILIWMASKGCRRQAQVLIEGLHSGTLFDDSDRIPGLSEL